MKSFETIFAEGSVFQPFQSRGTFVTLLSLWRSLDNQKSDNFRILTEPNKEYAEPLGSAEPRLINTGIRNGVKFEQCFSTSVP